MRTYNNACLLSRVADAVRVAEAVAAAAQKDVDDIPIYLFKFTVEQKLHMKTEIEGAAAEAKQKVVAANK
jgi:hypothetical protein